MSSLSTDIDLPGVDVEVQKALLGQVIADDGNEPIDRIAPGPRSNDEIPDGVITDLDDDHELKPKAFRLCHRCPLSIGFTMTLFVIISIIANTGQQITLPIFLSTLGNGSGPYFVLWFCSFAFTILFGAMTLLSECKKREITREMLMFRWHPYIALVSLMDAASAFLIVYSSPLSRTSGPVQAIAGQTIIPFTMLFSHDVLKKRYSNAQIFGCILVMISAFIALVPVFQRAQDGTYKIESGTWWWPMIFAFGQVPGALTNIMQEKTQAKFREETCQRFSIIYFQFARSFYQVIFLSLFFWLDFIPEFGTSSDLSDFSNNFRFGWQCLIKSESTADFYPIVVLMVIVSYLQRSISSFA